MRADEVLSELASITSGTGQHLADQIDNSDRNGCFEFCDGWPEALRQEYGTILLASAEIIRAGEVSDEESEALLQREALLYIQSVGKNVQARILYLQMRKSLRMKRAIQLLKHAL